MAIPLAAFACGGNDDDATPTDSVSTPTTSADGTAAPGGLAREMLPELDDLGFRLVESGLDPGQPSFESAVALYVGSSPQHQIQVRIYLLPTVEAATAQFDAFAVALRNPPPEFLGGASVKFIDATSPDLGEARKSYKTERADSQGFVAYTDVYRQGRTVLLTQVVEKTPDGMPARHEVGQRTLEGAP